MDSHKIVQWNCRSIVSKKSDLLFLINKYKPMALAIQETWLKPDFYFKIPGFSILREDRADGYSGVALLIRNSFHFTPFSLPSHSDEYSMIAAHVNNILVVSIYIPYPSSTIFSEINSILSNLPKPFLFLGDFNSHHQSWGCGITKRFGEDLLDILDGHNLCFLNNGSPTRRTEPNVAVSAVDLSITTADLVSSVSWQVLSSSFGSDHFPIVLSLPVKDNCNTQSRSPRLKYNLTHADWHQFSKEVDKRIVSLPNVSPGNEVMCAEGFAKTLIDSADIVLPIKNLRSDKLPSPPWWDSECTAAIKSRKEAEINYANNMTFENLSNLSTVVASTKKLLKKKKVQGWRNFCSSISPQTTSSEVWKKVHSVLIIISLIPYSNGFYVPGVAPVEFRKGQRIEVKAVKMTSIHTQLPYEYYSLPLCLPKNGTFVYKSENLGEVLRGDRIVNTPYEVHMAETIKCRLLCHHKNNPINWSVEESDKVASRIEHEYFVHLLVDNLPVATRVINSETSERNIEQGYRLGFMSKGKAYINNHLKLLLKYHKHSQDSYRVVGFEVETLSVDKDELIFIDDSCKVPEDAKPQLVNEDTGTKLYFTYSVEWGESDISWASRWDIYLGMKDVQIHWFSIVNSIVVLFFLSGILTMIMVRTLRRDIARYNSDESIDDMMEETGWKLVHGDVFRPPPKRMLFAAVIGSGIQVFLMALITIFVAMLGMLSPASRGALMTAAIFLYVFMGLIAGYYSARLYSTMKGKQWKQAAFLTATLYPAIVFGTCFFLNFFIMGKHSSGAVPFSTMMALLCLWFCISLPLVYLGYYFGCHQNQAFQHPVRTNFIPRKVPEQVWYMNVLVCIFMAGILPFGAVFIELFFIFNALWENQFYYLFGFLFLVFCILVVSVSQISIVMVYFQLCGEDYHWWWKSFIVSGGSAVYILIYSIFYFFTKLEITEFIPTLLYIGYTGLMVLTFWLLTGTIGFFAAYTFIRKIYAAVKID